MEVIQRSDSDRVDKAFSGTRQRISRDRRDVSQQKLDDDGAVRLGRDAAGVRRCVWAACGQSGEEDADDRCSRPVLEERMGE